MESLVEENARLRQEVVELKTTIERLERRIKSCSALWKRLNAPGSVGRRRSRGAGPKLILPSLGGKRGPGMVAVVGARFPSPLTEAWKLHWYDRSHIFAEHDRNLRSRKS